MAKTLGLLFALLFGLGLSAQSRLFSPYTQQAMHSIMNLRFAELDSLLVLERRHNPESMTAEYLEAAALSISLFLNEDAEAFGRQQARLQAHIAKLEQMDEADPWRGVFLGEMYLAQSGLQIKFGNMVKAGWHFYKAHGILKKNYRNHPDFLPNFISWGALNVALGSLPDGYQSFASFLGFKGDINLGLQLTRKAFYRAQALQEWEHYRGYAGFVYAYLNYQLQTQEQASLYTLALPVEQSSLYIYLEAYQLFDAGQSAQALALLQDRPRGKAYLDFPYLDYFTGKIALSQNLQSAEYYLRQYMASKGGKQNNYRASTLRYRAWIALLRGERQKCSQLRDEILNLGSYPTGADQQARAEAARGFNAVLVKARLYTDAGQAQKLLKLFREKSVENCCASPWERQEYFYRQGRAHQALEQNQQALLSYRMALAEAVDTPTYAQGNSALQVGLLLEEAGKNAEARQYFQLALSYKGFAFYEGIHQKAKAALARLDER